MKQIYTILFLLICTLANAGVPIVQPDLSKKTLIAPGYFGPNTFQVPQMNNGTVYDHLHVELAGDIFAGRLVPGALDQAADISLECHIPLFSDRANLTAWWPLHEWWETDDAVTAARRVNPALAGRGHDAGPAYISVDILLVTEQKNCPSVVVRSVLRTASEGATFASARSYDAPGYFFDITAGKDIGSFRVALSTGFLCWQTDNGRQNDAIMFGAWASCQLPGFSISAQYGGYWGWERDGDFPRTIRLRIDGDTPSWPVHPFIQIQHGFHDWPFDQIRFGITFNAFGKSQKHLMSLVQE